MRWQFLALFTSVVALNADLALSDETPIGDDIHWLPIFDSHMHYHEAAWSKIPPSLVVNIMDENKVSRSLVSAAPAQIYRVKA